VSSKGESRRIETFSAVYHVRTTLLVLEVFANAEGVHVEYIPDRCYSVDNGSKSLFALHVIVLYYRRQCSTKT
jgi:hypothetical protein